MSEKTKKVELPTEVIDEIKTQVKHTEFSSTSEYVTFVLEEVLYHSRKDTDSPAAENIDEQQVQDRLRDLGYLDS